jgi:hypothetical protein
VREKVMKARQSSFVLGVLIVCMSVATLTWGYSGGKGTPQDPYRIADANDLIQLGSTPADQDKHFVLVKDIDLAGRTWSTAVVPAFSGTFDGNNLTIRGLTITNGSALFGEIRSGSRVLNTSLVDVSIAGISCAALARINRGYVANCQSSGTINGTGEISGFLTTVGGLVGRNTGALRECSSSATVTSECSLPCVGGLVGLNNGSISNCFTTGTVTGIGDRPNIYTGVGGLAGWNGVGSVVSCYTTGLTTATDVASVGGIVGYGSAGAVANCYSVGLVQGTHYAGGIVGMDGTSIANCYRIGNVLGGSATKAGPIKGNTGGIITGCFSDSSPSGQVPKMSLLKDIQTYLDAGWDFVGESENGVSEVWEMPEGGGYPILSVRSGIT